MERVTYHGGRVFDGHVLHEDWPITIQDHCITEGAEGHPIDLSGDILAPAFVDLQVNGGGGVLFNDDPSVETLQRIADAHIALGTGSLLPTLITDSRAITAAAIDTVAEARTRAMPGIEGLHLEGPHLSAEKHGAHAPELIRPMETADLAALIEAKARVGCLKVTVAPETVTPDQIARLAEAGIYVSLGHSACDAGTGEHAFAAGARGVTHLFNAMSQMQSRAPGLVGAALASQAWAGLIADGVHVAPDVMRVALAASPKIFLVTDAMAVAGTTLDHFTLNSRKILRRDGELRLADGTLAGADLDMARAVTVLVRQCDVPLSRALAMATRLPAEAAGLAPHIGCLKAGAPCRAIRLRETADGFRVVPLDA